MKIFQNSFFKSKDDPTEVLYQNGVRHLRVSDYYAADTAFRSAAANGHVSAIYNLALLNGSGLISPYDIDFATECYYKAAHLGHPSASKNIFMLEAADRGGFGVNNLVHLASTTPAQDGLSALIMISACRFFSSVAKAHDATEDVIAIELDRAKASEDSSVLDFVKRTGVSNFYLDEGVPTPERGSAVDQIAEGINSFQLALASAGNNKEACLIARCTVIGYMISKSWLGKYSQQPLLGIDKFFS